MPPAFKKATNLADDKRLLNKKGWGSDEEEFEDGFNIDDGMYFKLTSDDESNDSEEEEESDDVNIDDYDEEEEDKDNGNYEE